VVRLELAEATRIPLQPNNTETIVGIFREGEDSRGDHDLGRLVEFRFKGPPGTTLTSSGRHRASWAYQPQKSVTVLPCPGGKTTKATRTCGGHWGGGHFCDLRMAYSCRNM